MDEQEEKPVEPIQSVDSNSTPLEIVQNLNSSTPTEPQHHKHAKAILLLFFIVLLAIIGGFSYLLMQENNNEIISENVSNTHSEETVIEQIDPSEDSLQLTELDVPEGFVVYRGDGFEFYYPEDWGTLRVTSTDDDPIFSAEFTNKTDARLYLNSGNQDFAEGGRGGAKWDCVGYTAIGDKEVACKIVHTEDETKKLSGGLLENFEHVKYQTSLETVILSQYNFFEEPIVEILFNPSSSRYYGGTLLITNTSNADVERMRQIASTFSVNLPDGL